MKKFAVNFGISLVGYLIMSFFVALFLGLPLQIVNGNIYAVFHTIVIAGLYFLLGIGLNSLGKHWLNYLSVCGSFIVALSLIFYNFGSIFAFNTSFAGIWHIVYHRNINILMLSIALTPLPSIFTWLGMVYKSGKLKKKQSEMTD